MRRIAAAVLFVFALVCCLTRPAFGQEGNATLTGFIQDSSKAVIPGVEVTAIDTNTNQQFTATTGKDGSYTIVSLPVGPYLMQIEKPGFKTILKDDLFLHTQDALQINFQMAVGSTSETVTVSGTATNDSPSVGMVVSHEEVENIPLNGRSFQDLIQLAPGTVSSAQGNGAFSINGQRDDANNFTVDGVSANLSSSVPGDLSPSSQQASGVYPAQTALGTTQALISVDAMQEFRIQTSGYTAEYGRQPGGQVEITSRSGTDQFHGTAYDYFRNTVFDANNWFSNDEGIPRLAEHQNDFGGTLGGPVTIPRIYYGKGKTFFFVSYEGLRLLLPQVVSAFDVPTSTFRQAAASGVQPFLNTLPLPNGPVNPDGITAQYSGGASSPSNIDSTSIRLDHTLTNKYRIFARLADTPSYSETLAPGSSPGAALQNVIDSLTVTAGATATFTPSLVDDFRFNFSRSSGIGQTVPYALGSGVTMPLNLAVPTQYASVPGGYISSDTISVSGTSLYDDYTYYKYPMLQHQLQLIDSLSWTRGPHTLKVGADYRRLTPTLGEGQYQTFFELSTLSDVQNGISDYLAVGTSIAAHPTFLNLSSYAQDHWRVSTKLTLDYGIRWEFNPPPGSSDGLFPVALSSSNLSVATLAPGGTPLYHSTYTNFAPRLGIAWRVKDAGEHPIVIRGGTGVFYDTGQNLGALAYESDNPPYRNVAYVNNGNSVVMPFTVADFAPPALNTSIAALTPPYPLFSGLADPDLKLPYTAQWNVSVDGGLNAKNMLTLSYVGNIGRNLLFYQNGVLNNPLLASYADYIATNASSSSYNALQLQDTGSIVPSLHVIASYTYSHSLDNSSTDTGGVGSLPIRGNSNNDLRQIVNSSLNYELPAMKSNQLTSALTQGWSLDDKFTAQSGYPIFVIQRPYLISPQQLGYVIPNLVQGTPLYLHNVSTAPGGWEINPAALSEVAVTSSGAPVGQNGDLPRNYLRAPGFWTMNSAVQKSTRITDQVRLLFRTEAFNVFNHPSFGNIQNWMIRSGFGEAQSPQTIGVANPLYAGGAPRSLQFMLKLEF